jgi:hypothetical protein
MRASKLLGLALGLMVALAVAVPAAHADERNQMTQLTINEPVQIPGHKVLEAGTYWFKLLDEGGANRNVLMIYNADRSQVLASVLTRPTYRADSTDRTELQFATTSRQPATLLEWFYPGRLAGHTFVYSPRTERKLREENMKDVLVTASPIVG